MESAVAPFWEAGGCLQRQAASTGAVLGAACESSAGGPYPAGSAAVWRPGTLDLSATPKRLLRALGGQAGAPYVNLSYNTSMTVLLSYLGAP